LEWFYNDWQSLVGFSCLERLIDSGLIGCLGNLCKEVEQFLRDRGWGKGEVEIEGALGGRFHEDFGIGIFANYVPPSQLLGDSLHVVFQLSCTTRRTDTLLVNQRTEGMKLSAIATIA